MEGYTNYEVGVYPVQGMEGSAAGWIHPSFIFIHLKYLQFYSRPHYMQTAICILYIPLPIIYIYTITNNICIFCGNKW